MASREYTEILSEGATVTIVKSESYRTWTDIFDGYTVKGQLLTTPRCGEPIILWRTERNGNKIIGLFTTSPVIDIQWLEDTTWEVRTENSRYLIKQETQDETHRTVVGMP